MPGAAQQLQHGEEKTAVVVDQTPAYFFPDRFCRDAFGFGLLATLGAKFSLEFESAIFTDVHLKPFYPVRIKSKNRQRMKYFFTCLLLGVFFWPVQSQSLYFPPNNNTVWDTIAPATLGYCPDRVDSLYDFLEGNNSKAFILLKDGKIVLEKYFDGFTKDSIWYWASAGKTVTSMLVGIAQQEGYLSIGDTTSDYLGQGWTSGTPEQEARITIRHQLTMTSGLNDLVADPYCTLPACLNYKADAGTRWAYHNAPYTLLDDVIQAATGQTLNAYFISKIRNPTGMNGFFLPSGYNNVLFTNPRSMARFGLLVLNKGNWNGTPVLADSAYFNQMVNTSQMLNHSYGYLWWLNGKDSYMLPGLQFVFPGSMSPDAPGDMFAALGKNGQVINIVPSQNLVFIRLGNAPDAGEVPVTLSNDIWLRINRFVCAPTASGDLETQGPDVTIYPNPASSEVRISLPGYTGGFEATIADATGREVMRVQNQDRLHVGRLARGMYILRVRAGGALQVKKLLLAPE